MVSELMDAYHNWNLDALRQNLNSTSAVSALQTPISWSSPIDTLYWPFTKDGEYSVKSGYRRIHDMNATPTTHTSTSSGIPRECWDIIFGGLKPQRKLNILRGKCVTML